MCVCVCANIIKYEFDFFVQAGLTNDNPTINFLECYTEVVLKKNVESLFACGGVVLCLSFTLSCIYMYTHLIGVWNLINSYSRINLFIIDRYHFTEEH